VSIRPSTGRHAAGRLPLAQPLPGSSHRHALPVIAGSGRGAVRATLRRAALLSGALGVLAVPVVATVVTQSPPDAAAAARPDAGAPAADLRTLQAFNASMDTAVGEQMATAAMQAAAEAQAAAVQAAAVQAAAVQAAAVQAAAVQAAAVQAEAVQAAAVQAAAVQAQAAATQAQADRLAQEQAAAARASRSRSVAPVPAPAASGDPRAIAQAMLNARGQGSQFSCLDQLWNRESGWSLTASNASSGAYGIPQSLPGSKMSSAGADWQTNPATQITWGLSYIADRYGSPCAAWAHSQSSGWY